MNADGTGKVNLTNNPTSSDFGPRYSPDGTKIAFQTDRDGNIEIYVMNADGTGMPTNITNNPTTDNLPSWSPDGTKIAFATNREGNQQVYVMNANGTGQTNISSNAFNDSHPSWSPDGTQIAFASTRLHANGDVFKMNADGTGQTALTNRASLDGRPDWSPDGTKILFDSNRADNNGDNFVMNTDGSSQTRLTFGGSFEFSPDWQSVPPIFNDEEGPIASGVIADPNPVAINTPIDLTATIDDTDTGGSTIDSASYTVDGGTSVAMDPSDAAFDEVSENVDATIPAFTEAGVHEICVSGTDTPGNVGPEECILLAVYDPSSGFVTGGGWIDSPPGAYTPDDDNDPDITGKANFGFVSKYKKGATIPTGQTEFQFQVADLNFHSESYDWLVIAGQDKAKYKGTGTINGSGGYSFMLTAIDNGNNGDEFRIKIWDDDALVYDNKAGLGDEDYNGTVIGGGNIKVHKK